MSASENGKSARERESQCEQTVESNGTCTYSLCIEIGKINNSCPFPGRFHWLELAGGMF